MEMPITPSYAVPCHRAMAKLRRTAGLTQSEVAERLGVSSRTISAWERGETSPRVVQVLGYLEAVGSDFGELATVMQGERPLNASELTAGELREVVGAVKVAFTAQIVRQDRDLADLEARLGRILWEAEVPPS